MSPTISRYGREGQWVNVKPLDSPAVSDFLHYIKDAVHQHRNIFKSHSTAVVREKTTIINKPQ